jgi:hypothetical protein
MEAVLGVIFFLAVFGLGFGARGCLQKVDCEESVRAEKCRESCGGKASRVVVDKCFCEVASPAEKKP